MINKIIISSLLMLSTNIYAGDIYYISLHNNSESIIDRHVYISEDNPLSISKYNNFNCSNYSKFSPEFNQENKLYLKITEEDNTLHYFFYSNALEFYSKDCQLSNKTKIIQAGSFNPKIAQNITILTEKGEQYILKVHK